MLRDDRGAWATCLARVWVRLGNESTSPANSAPPPDGAARSTWSDCWSGSPDDLLEPTDPEGIRPSLLEMEVAGE